MRLSGHGAECRLDAEAPQHSTALLAGQLSICTVDYALHLLTRTCSRLTTAAFEIGAALVFGSSLVTM